MTMNLEHGMTGQAKPPAPDQTAASTPQVSIPEDALVLVPVRNLVLFPGMILPATVGREASLAAAQYAVKNDRPVGLLLQRDPAVDEPHTQDLHPVGTAAQILRYVTTPDGTHHIVCQGEERYRVVEFLSGYPFLVARVERQRDDEAMGKELEAQLFQLRERATEALELLPQTPPELLQAVQAFKSPGPLADLIAGFMDVAASEKQSVLETFDVSARVDKVLGMLAHRIEVLKISRDIGTRTQATMDERQREYVLREQLRQIQKELGEGEGAGQELAELREAVEQAGMPEETLAHAKKELKRLERMPEASAEYSMARTYLDWLVELPWSKTTEGTIDIAEARRILDEDHFGLDKIKRRIVEFLAVRKLNPGGHGPILCFVGPPGVGKTSLGQSIARALGRKFERVALGGVHDEAEIRGHRRTYIGALPGVIIQGIKKAGTRDCVMMLDEIDKVGASAYHGDPSSALLEVLDPEQNKAFRDTYLGVTFDLSRVIFITTANMLDTIPGPLRDRMEIIQLPGYTAEEKLEIAKRYLVKRQREANGLKPGQATITDAALEAIVGDYTREAGVRNLEREIGSVLRNAATRVAEGSAEAISIDRADLVEVLGPAKFEAEIALRTSMPGVATGLAWTPVGGDILFVEASRTPGAGKLILTGQLGDVMKESAQAALTLLKSRAESLGLPTDFDKWDIHVHVPAGAIPKDGPSAGVAMFMALTSLYSGRTVRSDTAMTGEISLRGLVLPVGGIKEKVLAALRAGIETVMLPARNRKDLVDVPQGARDRLDFVWLETVDDAMRHALASAEVPSPVPAECT